MRMAAASRPFLRAGQTRAKPMLAKSERQVVIHEAHVEDVAVAEHGDETE